MNLVSHLPTVRYRQGGTFNIEANTSSARLALDFPTAPVDSVVNVIARTTNRVATVKMHPTWEGDFQASTKGEMIAIYDTRPSDPSGKSRERRVTAIGKTQLGRAHEHGEAGAPYPAVEVDELKLARERDPMGSAEEDIADDRGREVMGRAQVVQRARGA